MTDHHRFDPGRARFITVVDLFALCRAELRLEILAALASGPIDVGALSDRLDVAFTTVSDHLQHLQDGGLAEYTRDGHRHVYRLGPAVRAVTLDGWLKFTLLADDGSIVETRLPPDVMRKLLRGREPDPGSNGSTGASGHGGPGRVPESGRPPTAPGSP